MSQQIFDVTNHCPELLPDKWCFAVVSIVNFEEFRPCAFKLSWMKEERLYLFVYVNGWTLRLAIDGDE